MFLPLKRRAPLTALLVCVLLLASANAAWAGRTAGGPGCASGPDAIINNAVAGDIFTPLYEQDFGRNTNGAVAKVDLEIEGGWSAPNFDCGGNSSGVFSSRADMLAAGLTYNPSNRSELRGFGERVVGLDSAVKSFTVRNVIFTQFSNFTGNGGDLAQSSAGLSAANIAIDNSLFRSDVSSGVTIAGDGGGLYLELDNGATLTITGSTFSDNAATNGGALQVRLRGNSKLIITDSSFQNNSASGEGGAIRVILESGSVVISRSQFSGNSATVGGRDIRIQGPVSLAAVAARPTVYLIGNSYSASDTVQISGTLDVFTEQVTLPLVVR
jgi:hypothetical protein